MRNLSAPRLAWLRFLFSPNQRLIGVFFIFILLPGTFLGYFAFRVLRQEGQLVKQRTRERLERTAKAIGDDLASEFGLWEEAVRLSSNKVLSDAGTLPEIVQEILERPGGGVLVSRSDKGIETFPSGALSYIFPVTPAPRIQEIKTPAALSRAESLEIVQRDYRRAILAYRSLLKSVDAGLQPVVLQRLARTLRKAGRLDEAENVYRELERLDTVWLGGLPSDLLARFELCSLAYEGNNVSDLADRALALYRDLTGGKWILEKPRYMFYSASCRSWFRGIQMSAGEFERFRIMEQKKLALSLAAEKLVNDPQEVLTSENEIHLAFWHPDPFTAVILSEGLLGSLWWPRVVSSQGNDIKAVLYSYDGNVLFGSLPVETPPFAIIHDVRIDEISWRVQVWPNDPRMINRDIRQRQNLFFAILVFVAAFLLFGSYFTVRIVRRELEISRLRADFVSTVSHEFRSPLTGIRQLGEMLLDGRAKDRMKQREYYRMIVQESHRLTRLVENILDFSRMEEGRKEYRFEPLDSSRWLRRQVSVFEAGIPLGGVAVETDIPEGLPPILADSDALGSAVHNLLDNAVKYSPGETKVWLGAETVGDEVRIDVRDKGIGISETDCKHIFDRFYRVDGEISKRIKGAGLGLSLVRHIVTAHGGQVECKSKPGEGSMFTIRIPALSTD